MPYEHQGTAPKERLDVSPAKVAFVALATMDTKGWVINRTCPFHGRSSKLSILDNLCERPLLKPARTCKIWTTTFYPKYLSLVDGVWKSRLDGTEGSLKPIQSNQPKHWLKRGSKFCGRRMNHCFPHHFGGLEAQDPKLNTLEFHEFPTKLSSF